MKKSVRSKNKALNFPNQSRSFDSTRRCVRFWGYDSTIEISFFVEAAALLKLVPDMGDDEAEILMRFDAVLERIHEAANCVYVGDHKDSYAFTLVADDF